MIYRNGKKIREISKYLGEMTNNQAEYKAFGIAAAEALKIAEVNSGVSFFSDSLLLVNQINGRWRVKDKNIFYLREKAVKKIKTLETRKKAEILLKHIPRAENKEADFLSSLAIKQKN